MKEYHFQITLAGEGSTPKEAWKDICKHLSESENSLGEFDKSDIIEIIDTES
jgi:hypothetical protein|tara:strand:- start:20 stop:175 length:156 start_codon:yes stop_codon:yes gene_type:complete